MEKNIQIKINIYIAIFKICVIWVFSPHFWLDIEQAANAIKSKTNFTQSINFIK